MRTVQLGDIVVTEITMCCSELGLYGGVTMSPQPVTPTMGVPELIRQSHVDAGWDSSIAVGGVLTPAVTSKVLCRLSQQVDR